MLRRCRRRRRRSGRIFYCPTNHDRRGHIVSVVRIGAGTAFYLYCICVGCLILLLYIFFFCPLQGVCSDVNTLSRSGENQFISGQKR